MARLLSFLFIIFLPFIFPGQIYAHAFGQLYNLPVPFWLYLYGGAAAIIVSFLVIGYFFNKDSNLEKYPTVKLSKLGLFSTFTKLWFVGFLKLASVFLLFLTIAAGLVGENDPTVNFNMTFFWVIFVLGFAYFVAIFGDLWTIINPWKVLTNFIGKAFGKNLVGITGYPKPLGYWPAFIFYFLFIWFELFGRTMPFSLSGALLIYTTVNVAGVFLIGGENWFKYCEFFSVFFRMLGKISLVETRGGSFYLRAPFVGLLTGRADNSGLVIFILFMLSTTAFDGFKSTAVGFAAVGILVSFTGIFFGQGSFLAVQTAGILGLLVSPLIFLYLYLMLLAIAKVLSGSTRPLKELALDFAFSLIPIAFVYNVAHYYTLILTEGWNMIRIISDPFGFGWNLFGTSGFATNPLIISANIGWHLQVGIILVGHIAGVYLAHMNALGVFPSHKKALISQLPMLVLMVTYTLIGLWILAQPIVAG